MGLLQGPRLMAWTTESLIRRNHLGCRALLGSVKSSLYLLLEFSTVPFTKVLITGISTMVNGTVLNSGKRYKDDLMVIFDKWPKLYLGFDAEPKIQTLKVIYHTPCSTSFTFNNF